MKVCIFLPSLAGGGAQISMLRVATVLIDHGHIVDLVTALDDQAPNVVPDERLPYRTFGRRHTRESVFDLARHLRATRPDVLLTAMDHANVAGLVAARLSRTRVPVVVSFRSDVSAASRLTSGAFSRIRPAIARQTMKQAAHVIAISEGVRRSLLTIAPGYDDKITTIYNPTVRPELFDLSLAPVDEPDGFDLGSAILAVGRLAPEKGFDDLLRAFAQVVDRHPELHLLILGEGALRPELEALVDRLGLHGRAHLPGYVENPYTYMKRCRMFAFSSHWEGLGNVLVEAGALGCTIVATDCESGPRELLEGKPQATLVPPGDPDALAEAILAALDVPEPAPASDWSEHTMATRGAEYERVLLGVVGGGSSTRPRALSAPRLGTTDLHSD